MINGLDIYYSKNIGRGLKPVSNNKQTILTKERGLKPISIFHNFHIIFFFFK